MPKEKTKFFVVTPVASFDTLEEAGNFLATTTEDVQLLKGKAVEFSVKREPTVVFGSPKQKRIKKAPMDVKPRKPRQAVLGTTTNGQSAEF